MKERFCAICERKLTRKDSEHVCRVCFRAAREPKEVVLTDQQATNIAISVGIGQLFCWGLGKLSDLCKEAALNDKTFDCPLV